MYTRRRIKYLHALQRINHLDTLRRILTYILCSVY
jgi:hypothetical protein